MCSPPQGLRHSSPPSTGSQDDLLEPGESTSRKPVRSLTLALLLLPALGGCALPSARDATLETSLREASRRADRGARVRAGSRWPAGHASGRPLLTGAHGRAVRVDRAADRRAGAVVLRRKRPVLRPARAAHVVRELPGGGRPRRARRDTAVSGGPRSRRPPRPHGHGTLDRPGSELLPLAGRDAALLAQRPTDPGALGLGRVGRLDELDRLFLGRLRLAGVAAGAGAYLP